MLDPFRPYEPPIVLPDDLPPDEVADDEVEFDTALEAMHSVRPPPEEE